MEVMAILMILVIFLLPTALWIWAIVDIIRSEFSENNKVIWLLVVLLVPLLGIILYALIGRKQKLACQGPGQAGNRFCQSCGESVPATATICSKCNTAQPGLRKSNNTVAIVVAVALVLFVGVGFVGILAAIAIPQFSSYRVKSYDSAAQSDLRNIKTALESYLADNQQYPSSLSEITYTPSKDVEVVVRKLEPDHYVIITGHKKGSTWYLADSTESGISSAPMGDENSEFLPQN